MVKDSGAVNPASCNIMTICSKTYLIKIPDGYSKQKIEAMIEEMFPDRIYPELVDFWKDEDVIKIEKDNKNEMV